MSKITNQHFVMRFGNIFSITLPSLVFLFICLATARAQFSWSRVETLPKQPVYTLTKSGDRMYAATSNTVYRSFDGGATWLPGGIIHQQEDEVIDLLAVNGVLYAAMAVGGCYVSLDEGKSWLQDNAGLEGPGAQNISMIARRGDSLYVSTHGSGIFVKPLKPSPGLWKSYNFQQLWGNVGSIVEGGGTMLAGTGFSATLSLCELGNHAWTEHSFDVFNGTINGFLGGVKRGDTWLGAGTQGLYRSTDDGRSWERYNPGIGLISIAGFARRQAIDIALLTKSSGQSYLFATQDLGETWSLFDPALPSGHTAYDLLEFGDQLFCGRADGLWVLSSTTSASGPDRSTAELLPLYPNPSNQGRIVLPFVLQQPAEVKAVFIDVRGQVLKTAVLGRLAAGKHEESIDLHDFDPGVVFCALYIDKQAITQKFQIIK